MLPFPLNFIMKREFHLMNKVLDGILFYLHQRKIKRDNLTHGPAPELARNAKLT